MARSIATIYAAIVADKDAQTSISTLAPTADTEQTLLAAVNSSSKVAIWRLWAYIVATAIHTHELLFDGFSAEVSASAAAAITGTAQWYQTQIFAYQAGDTLTYDPDTGKFAYPTITPANQIVKRCAVVEDGNGVVNFKVAKLSGLTIVGLSIPEQTALSGYIKKIRFSGTRFTITSGNGDIIRVFGTVYHADLVPLTTLAPNVTKAIVEYLGALPFDGQFLISSLVDAVQKVSGVSDFVATNVQTRPDASGVFSQIARNHTPVYGYYTPDTTAGFTLNDTITFISI